MKQILTPFLIILLLSTIISCDKDKKNDISCNDTNISQDASKSNRKVIVIGIDGVRADAMQAAYSPFLYSLSQSSETYYTNMSRTEDSTDSGPNWASLVTGVHYTKHLITDNHTLAYDYEKYPHFFKYIEQANSDLNTVSIANWFPINLYYVRDYGDFYSIPGINDATVYNDAMEILNNQNPMDADIMFLHFDNLDAAGHHYGFHPDTVDYTNSLMTIDGYVNDIVTAIETKRDNGEDWMVFIVSDHGGEGKGHHQFDNSDVFNTVFFANHPSIAFKDNISNTHVNLAPTILDFMGISSEEFDCNKDGESILQ